MTRHASEVTVLEALEPRMLLAVVAPSQLTVQNGYREEPDPFETTRAHLNWVDNINTTQTGYRVEWSEDGGLTWPVQNSIDFVNEPQRRSWDQVLDAGQDWEYRVRALEGTNVSGPSPVRSPLTPRDASMRLTATLQTAPTLRISLHWPADANATEYRIFRKLRSATSWGAPIATIGSPQAPTSTGYDDNTVAAATGYEYQIQKLSPIVSGGSAYGYIYSAIGLPLVESRGTVLIVVDNQIIDPSFTSAAEAALLVSALDQFKQDLIGDGHVVRRIDVQRDNDSTSDRHQAAQIKSLLYEQLGLAGSLSAIILIGHILRARHVRWAP